MTKAFLRNLLLVPVLFPVVWIISCSGSSGRLVNNIVKSDNSTTPDITGRFIKMQLPAENEECRLNEQIKVALEPENKNLTPDSVRIQFDSRTAGVLKAEPWSFIIPNSLNTKTGRKPVKITAYTKGKIQTITRFVIVYSDIKPLKRGFVVVHEYPHDPEAFTQGLFYDKGLFYEGTGQETVSWIREVNPETGRVNRQHNLDPSLFGEGITLYRDKIYQVTWRNKIGFVYDRATFNTINKIYYQTEGWGLTTIGDKIVMSDGSNILYFIEPEMFNVVSRIEVYDNTKKVDQLNELEYIKGEIWANIWQTDLIARIDPATGKVNSYIDMSSLYPEKERIASNADVLNGIAYDSDHNRIFVTGKRWPKLYEIKVSE